MLHDVGYTGTYEGHEEVSCRIGRQLLSGLACPEEKINQVMVCINATRFGSEPQTQLEKLMHDADRAHLAAEDYLQTLAALREEWSQFKERTWSENEWHLLNHQSIKDHTYFTEAARALWEKRKNVNQKSLKKLVKEKLDAVVETHMTATRSAQMMFKTSLRNHIDLRNLADNKANIMLSINAIIITITMPLAANYVTANPFLMVPMGVLLSTCLLAMFFATLATRPSKMSGKTSDDAVQQGEANLFFFGNFYNMDFDEYRKGMRFIAAD